MNEKEISQRKKSLSCALQRAVSAIFIVIKVTTSAGTDFTTGTRNTILGGSRKNMETVKRSYRKTSHGNRTRNLSLIRRKILPTELKARGNLAEKNCAVTSVSLS